MNFTKVFLSIIISCSAAFTQPASTSEECKAGLTVETDSEQALIFLNGRLAGSGKVRTSFLKGKYIIMVKENVNKWNPGSFTDTLLADECREYSLNYRFNSEVYLKTEPQDVYVYNADTLLGHTPLLINSGLLHEKTLELKKPGYRDKILDLGELGNGEIIKLNYLGKNSEKSFFEKDIFKILVGSLTVLGGATAYFKLKADDEFEKYQFSGSSESLDKTRKYDLISGISFAALQINFGFLIYFFLFD